MYACNHCNCWCTYLAGPNWDHTGATGRLVLTRRKEPMSIIYCDFDKGCVSEMTGHGWKEDKRPKNITENISVIGLPFLHLQSRLGRQDESGKTWIQHLNRLSIIKIESLKVKVVTSIKNNKRILNSRKKKFRCAFLREELLARVMLSAGWPWAF